MSALKVKSILADIDDFLTEKARAIYNKPRVGQSVGEIDGVPYKVQYLAILTNSRVTGAIGIAQIVNDCVENYNVLGVLAVPSQLQLANTGMVKGKIASIAYLAFDLPSAKRIERELYCTMEGALPTTEYEESPDAIKHALANGMRNLDEEPV